MVAFVTFVFWLLSKAIDLYMMAIVVYALLSWFPGAYQTKLGQLLGAIVEPFQRWFNFATIGMIGFAPLVAIFVLGIVRSGLVYLEQIVFRLMGM
ncbi:cell division membrane protein [Secundilactobacillus pentosiphilus]|uniref:Cell division membrane protein n=1 Tax=Secundilactobacillus pentosiphilus TaxID=1714682 RepID=A0A1Z5IQ95_9LACO|nr:YggT family protein [Secundilactobacillus pentosiphilus]GAX03601.1 cell division membrane protein [Secundilactobacillus pentosiphilus]